MIEPRRAPVRPRVFSQLAGECLPAEDAVPLARPGCVGLVGGPGAGKTTALQHLAILYPGLAMLDEPTVAELVLVYHRSGHVLFTASPALASSVTHGDLPERLQLTLFHLATWMRDEVLEYLLAAHRPACASVMARLRGRSLPDWPAEIWRTVLDRMAQCESIPEPQAALVQTIDELIPEDKQRNQVRDACLQAIVQADVPLLEQTAGICLASGPRILRHRAVHQLLAADCVVAALRAHHASFKLVKRLPLELVNDVAARVRTDSAAIAELQSLVSGRPMVASILHAAEIGWRPTPRQVTTLAGAYLDAATWPGVNLAGIDLSDASLRRADLSGANLSRADLRRANLSRASLVDAQAANAKFIQANLRSANCERIEGKVADFRGADLRQARFAGSKLVSADLVGSSIEEADFTATDFFNARLCGLDLRQANFQDASFRRANLTGCDLEGMTMPLADFHAAKLSDVLLTGCSMPGADFASACLENAKLADVNWEGANLRGANLQGADFHMGSSRSGRVGSPIASEGSRTGFYTDDYDDRSFKNPEEIRKANLCGCDLRGAQIDGVDFYLVDLRGARYDAHQDTHLRRCGAILDHSLAD